VSEAALEHRGDGRYALCGPLDYGSVAALLQQGRAAFSAHPEVELDLAGVTRANSAGLALLLEWLDDSRDGGYRIQLRNLPASLAAIARISNLHQLLPLPQD